MSAKKESLDFMQIALAPEFIASILRPGISPSFWGCLSRSFLTRSLKASSGFVVCCEHSTLPVQAAKSWVRDYLPPNTKAGRQTSVVSAVGSLEIPFLFFVNTLHLVLKVVLGGLLLNNPSLVIF